MDSLFFLVFINKNGEPELWKPEEYMYTSLQGAMVGIKQVNENHAYRRTLPINQYLYEEFDKADCPHTVDPKLIGIQAYHPQFMSYLEMEE